MRKAQKKQIADFLELLGQAHEEIRRELQQNHRDVVLQLLEDCQGGAISVGTLIEKTEGEDAPSIGYIEEYCELVYQIHAQLLKGEPASAGGVYKLLRKHFAPIASSVQNHIPVRLEVVFLPYKASMWDSLESVWKAAVENPDCDAYVVPIPYYDKDPKGNLGQLHYEIDLYPADVPVVRYEDYDFEKRKPDIIFIHNAYDECSFVTSVMPYFYTERLKQFTECLVYIPYFILDETDLDKQEKLEQMKHYCTVSGVEFVDYIVVQSEAMRKAYIRVLTDFCGADTRNYWEHKVLGLGSPKADKILEMKKEEIEIPKEWLRVIKKPSGEWKKIILYNTSVSALIQYEEQALHKMREVFRVFREHQEEIALLWRPHPLIQATIESMHPQLALDYWEILKQYKDEGWGIYDDSPDLDRALVLSDGYYGDPSSLVPLSKMIGHPVLIQNAEVR